MTPDDGAALSSSGVQGCCAAILAYAPAASRWACRAVASSTRMSPTMRLSGVMPLIDLPGLTPTLPLKRDRPLATTDDPPRTAKLCAAPSDGAVCAAIAWDTYELAAVPTTRSRRLIDVIVLETST